MDYEKLGTRVRQQRVLNRLTQEQLAEMAGVSLSFIGHIERGEKKASLDTLVSLCNALVISPTVLLQDSLSGDVMRSHISFAQENQGLMEDLMNVLREYAIKPNEP